MLENNTILNYAKVGVIQSINTISEKIKKVEKRLKSYWALANLPVDVC